MQLYMQIAVTNKPTMETCVSNRPKNKVLKHDLLAQPEADVICVVHNQNHDLITHPSVDPKVVSSLCTVVLAVCVRSMLLAFTLACFWYIHI